MQPLHPPRLQLAGAGGDADCGSDAGRSGRRGGGPGPGPGCGCGGAEGRSGPQTIDSPLVGTFYRAPSPEAQPYAKIGDRVSADTVVGIIEAMKVLNEIKAEKSGVIKEILVENGQPVEYGEALFVIE